jgi:ATP-dependent RNA helicase SUPV3L1/SUV3
MVPIGSAAGSNIAAILGPTNTGKTYRAIERMLECPSGMIGLPLRLLARELYDRVTTRVGENRVALITGEEKRIPPHPDYWLCTVEAMPIDRAVDFLAVDEIQLATHPERGHVFTDRLLNARGTRETWFMGSDSMHQMIEQLVPTARFKRYPRFSSLRDKGRSTINALTPRTAVIAFSASRVYEIAERIRQKKGGAAIVLGSLSPRTRNAQVALYQAGEVDYLVATDAIGMGLNMDVDHVAFAELKKFDGRETRLLEPIELAQIAGRAGRYLNDGTFGTLSPLPDLPKEVVRAIESHRFPQARRLVWRNSDLDMSSVANLIASLKKRPRLRLLRPIEQAEDFAALLLLAQLPKVGKRATTPQRIALLWDVCRIPDYGGVMVEHHTKLLAEVFLQLTGPKEQLDPEWMDRSISRIDNINGSIDNLLSRIEQIRTWTFISYHSGWVHRAKNWQARALDIEERLSDALHQRLVERFVEKSGTGISHVGRRTRRQLPESANETTLIDSPFKRLLDVPLKLRPAPGAGRQLDLGWVQPLIDAPFTDFQLDPMGRIVARERPLAQLVRGPDLLHPQLKLLISDELGPAAKMQLERRLVAWTRDLISDLLSPLRQESLRQLSAAGKGLVYQLEQQLGTVLSRSARGQINNLTKEDLRLLSGVDCSIGKRVIYLRRLLKPVRVSQRIALCSAHLGRPQQMPTFAKATVSVPRIASISEQTYLTIGYPVFGSRAIRADFVERIDKRLYLASKNGPFELPHEMSNWLGCARPKLSEVVKAFGYRQTSEGLFEKRRSRGAKSAPV